MSKRRRVPEPTSAPAPTTAESGRARLPWFDAIWDKLPVSARRAFVTVAQGEDEEGITNDELAILLGQALVAVDDDGVAHVQPGAEGFADRIAKLADYPVLFGASPGDLEDLIASSPPAPALVTVALSSVSRRGVAPGELAELDDVVRAIQSVDWLRHMPPMIERLPGVQRALGLLAANVGLLPISRLTEEVGANGYPALDVLLSHFVVFEGLEPKTLRLMVGLLPSLRGGDGVDVDPDDSFADEEFEDEPPSPPPPPPKAEKTKSKAKEKKPAPEPVLPSPPPALPRPTELSVAGTPLAVEDIEALLVGLAGRRVRISQRGEVYVEDEAALLEAALGSRPCPLLPLTPRGNFALRLAERTGLTGGVDVGGLRLLRPANAAAQEWMEWPLARRWRSVVGMLLDGNRQDWLGGSLDQSARSLGPWPPEPNSAAITLAPFVDLAAGTFHSLDALLTRWEGELNPLYRLLLARMKQRGLGGQEHQHLLVSQLRYVLDDPDLARDPLGSLDRLYTRGVRALFVRLTLIGGVELGAVGEDLHFALTEVGRHYLGFEKRFPRLDETPETPARVVVQPNLEVLVIGRAPAASLALSTIATAKEGESGPARTFVLSRERVIEAIAHGAKPDSIAKTLEAAAQGSAIPPNVLRTVNDWARAVRRVKVVHVPVLVCDDEETALTVRSHAGKGVLVADHGVPVDPTKLAAFKRTLLKKGIVVDEDPNDDKRRRR